MAQDARELKAIDLRRQHNTPGVAPVLVAVQPPAPY
jgi:hypothetical protein